MVERVSSAGNARCARDVPPPVPPRPTWLRTRLVPGSPPNDFGDERIVELATVRQHVRVRARRDAQLPLSYEPPYRRPCASPDGEEGRFCGPKVVRREHRHCMPRAIAVLSRFALTPGNSGAAASRSSRGGRVASIASARASGTPRSIVRPSRRAVSQPRRRDVVNGD